MSLTVIREGVQFRPDAAASFRRYEARLGRQASVNRTVVPRAEQAALYALRLAGKYPYPVAHPDYSNHVYEDDERRGNAWDTEERGTLLDEYGWIADVPGEPWHREYRRAHDQHLNDPTPTEKEESDPMGLRIISSPYYRAAGYQVIHNGLAAKPIPNVVAGALRSGGVPSKDYEDEDGLNAEISEVWALGGLVSTSAADATLAEFGDRIAR